MSVQIRKKKLSDGRSSLYLDYYENGKRKYEFLKIYLKPGDLDNKEKLRQAEKVRAKRELEDTGTRYGLVTEHNRTMGFLAFAENYLGSYGKRDVRMVKYALKKFEEYLEVRKIPRQLRMDQITPELCDGFRTYLLSPGAGLKGETPQNYLARFRRILKSAETQNLIVKDPSRGISIRRTIEFRKEVLSGEEIQLLAKTPCGNETVRRAFLFSCFTGVGLAEVREITSANIRNDRFVYLRKKTQKTVNLYLHPSARALLDPTPRDGSPAFVLPSSTAINKCLQHWVQRAKLPHHKITYYSARHSYATNLLRNGTNLKTVADCMGHATVTHTIKYLNYVNELKDEAVRGLIGL